MEHTIVADSVRNYQINFTRLRRHKIHITSLGKKKLVFK